MPYRDGLRHYSHELLLEQDFAKPSRQWHDDDLSLLQALWARGYGLLDFLWLLDGRPLCSEDGARCRSLQDDWNAFREGIPMPEHPEHAA